MVRLAEIAVFLMQGAEFRDGVVICEDRTELSMDSAGREAWSGLTLEALRNSSSGASVLPREAGRPTLMVFVFLAWQELAPVGSLLAYRRGGMLHALFSQKENNCYCST